MAGLLRGLIPLRGSDRIGKMAGVPAEGCKFTNQSHESANRVLMLTGPTLVLAHLKGRGCRIEPHPTRVVESTPYRQL